MTDGRHRLNGGREAGRDDDGEKSLRIQFEKCRSVPDPETNGQIRRWNISLFKDDPDEAVVLLPLLPHKTSPRCAFRHRVKI